jgi:hypothetical protein
MWERRPRREYGRKSRRGRRSHSGVSTLMDNPGLKEISYLFVASPAKARTKLFDLTGSTKYFFSLDACAGYILSGIG